MRIAVVIPVRNDAEALERCIQALERQTRPADELVVVDNGSSDGSAEVGARHGARLVHVAVPGIPGATAAGFDHAAGDVLVRLDSDSLAPEDWLARIEAAFTREPALAALSGAARFYGGPLLVRFGGRLSLTVGYFRLIAAVIGHMPLYGSNFALRADVWRRMEPAVHRDRADVHDDLDLSLQLPPGALVRYDRELDMAVSSRSFTRPGGFGHQLRLTVTTFLVTSRDTGLLRLRLAWFLASPAAGARSHGPLDRLERGEREVARRLWGPFAAGLADVEAPGGAQVVGQPR